MEPTITELLSSGLQLMVVGMGIVFAFLALLVGAVSALPRLLHRAMGEQAFEQVVPAALPSPVEPAIDADGKTAIEVAIRLYENNQ